MEPLAEKIYFTLKLFLFKKEWNFKLVRKYQNIWFLKKEKER